MPRSVGQHLLIQLRMRRNAALDGELLVHTISAGFTEPMQRESLPEQLERASPIARHPGNNGPPRCAETS